MTGLPAFLSAQPSQIPLHSRAPIVVLHAERLGTDVVAVAAADARELVHKRLQPAALSHTGTLCQQAGLLQCTFPTACSKTLQGARGRARMLRPQTG